MYLHRADKVEGWQFKTQSGWGMKEYTDTSVWHMLHQRSVDFKHAFNWVTQNKGEDESHHWLEMKPLRDRSTTSTNTANTHWKGIFRQYYMRWERLNREIKGDDARLESSVTRTYRHVPAFHSIRSVHWWDLLPKTTSRKARIYLNIHWRSKSSCMTKKFNVKSNRSKILQDRVRFHDASRVWSNSSQAN